MTSSEPSPTRPLRVAGLALLGVAAIALVIGLFTMFGGDGDDGNGDGQADGTRPPATSSSPASETSSSDEGTSSETPESSTGATTSGSATPSTSTQNPPPPGGDGNGEAGKDQPVRVFNNSTIAGLAARAKGDLEEAGWTVNGVGNYSSGVIRTTTVYFRPGTPEEAAAEVLADEFGMRTEPRFAGIANSSPGLIVIVTNDYQGPGGTRSDADEDEKNDR